MASLDQTITVNVLRSPGGVPRGNFGLAMWMTHEQFSPLRAASYADINEVNLVYPDGSETRDAANVFFGQSPRPNKHIIGTKLGSVNIVPVAVNDTLYEVVINGITIPFTSDADEPSIAAGQDSAPNSMEYVLHALASCLTGTLVSHAAVRGIRIEAVESSYTGNMDVRGLFGMSDDVRKGFNKVTVNMRVKSEASAEDLTELALHSPVYDMVSRALPVEFKLTTC